jgi:predicted XRE-type DNA-binding protein
MDDNRVIRGSGNIYADLGFDDPELEQAKAKLARRISELIEARGLTQTAAAELLGIPGSNLSKIVRGRLGEFSIERLIRLLRRFDQDVQIVVSPSDQPGRLIATIPALDERTLAAASPPKNRAARFS